MKRMLCAAILAVVGQALAFAPGERVLFLGDSITHGGLYLAYLEMATAGSSAPVILNGGIYGDTCASILGSKRLSWDVADRRPDRVFVMLGMNDVRRVLWKEQTPSAEIARQRDQAIADYATNLERIVDDLGSRGLRTVLMTPSPYDQYGTFDGKAIACCNEPGLSRCAAAVKALAKRKGLPVVDVHAPLTALLRAGDVRRLCGTDRVHPAEAGSALIAAVILKEVRGSAETIEEIAANIRNDRRAPAARAYAKSAEELRRLAEYERLVRAFGTDPKDAAACDRALDAWVASEGDAAKRAGRQRDVKFYRWLRGAAAYLRGQLAKKREAVVDLALAEPVFAVYRPKHASDWQWGKTPAEGFSPLAGRLEGTNAVDVAQEIEAASLAGIGGFLVLSRLRDGSLAGDDVIRKGFLGAANRGKMRWAALYDGPSGELGAFAERVAADWSGDANYFRRNGRPCLFVRGSFPLPQREIAGLHLVSLADCSVVSVGDADFVPRCRTALSGRKTIVLDSWNDVSASGGVALLPSMLRLSYDLQACWSVFGAARPECLPGMEMWTFWNRQSPSGKAFLYESPTMRNVKYGPHLRQTIDLWLPAPVQKGVRRPLALCIHGGGWDSGSGVYNKIGKDLEICRRRGAIFASMEYRLLQDAKLAGVQPPVRYPLEDAVAAVRHLKDHADEYGIDPDRILLFGGSAGACSSLYAALQGDCELGVKAVFADVPQTSMDPQEVVGWIPNQTYGGHAFGYPDFKSFLADRDKWLDWIRKYSPAGLVRLATPAKVPRIFYHQLPLPPKGELPKDTAHAGMFCVRFQEICDGLGLKDRVGPGMFSDAVNFLVK